MTPADRVGDLLRPLVPQVLGALVRRYGHFDECEDAVQEALLAAATQWPVDGVPANPRAWLITVASRRLTDSWRSDEARRRREASLPEPDAEPAPGEREAYDRDDTLLLLFLCCHPALSADGQIALTLRAVGGLTTGQIARAFLVPESTMGQRISRAKQRVKTARFELPDHDSDGKSGATGRLDAVRRVLYLIFNEGYAVTSGIDLQRPELTDEAIRLAREVHALRPDDGESAGLLALMLLTDARRPARTGPGGALIPLDEQDRTRWNAARRDEGLALIRHTLVRAPIGPYQLQAAIAAVHAEAENARQTDWPQILGLYQLLDRLDPSPVITLNHAVALAMVRGPRAGLDLLATLAADDQMVGYHRLAAVRAHLLELAGEPAAARLDYELAARLTTSLPEQRYLTARAARLASPAV